MTVYPRTCTRNIEIRNTCEVTCTLYTKFNYTIKNTILGIVQDLVSSEDIRVHVVHHDLGIQSETIAITNFRFQLVDYVVSNSYKIVNDMRTVGRRSAQHGRSL